MKIAIFSTALLLAGCATPTKNLMVGSTPPKEIKKVRVTTVSPDPLDLNTVMKDELSKRNMTIVGAAPNNEMKADDADVVIYFHADEMMDFMIPKWYVKSIDIDFFDAKTGTVIVSNRWAAGQYHGYPDKNQLMSEILNEIFAKIKERQNSILQSN